MHIGSGYGGDRIVFRLSSARCRPSFRIVRRAYIESGGSGMSDLSESLRFFSPKLFCRKNRMIRIEVIAERVA